MNLERFCRVASRLYRRSLRKLEHGLPTGSADEAVQVFEDLQRDAARSGGWWALAVCWGNEAMAVRALRRSLRPKWKADAETGGGPMSGSNWIEALWRDLHLAARGLRKSPSFALVAIMVLALGTGANTAVFSIVRAILLRPLPFHDPDQVMLLYETIPKRGVNRSNLSAANFFDLQQRSRSFTGTALMSGRGFAVTGDASPEQVSGALVSSSFFSVLGVSPARGRSFRAEDEDPGAPGAVMLSDRLWQRRFGRDVDVLGKTIFLDGRAHQIVGVMPEGFQGVFRNHELWVPIQLTSAARNDRTSHSLLAVGRLTAGVSLLQAQADLDAIGNSLAREYPAANTGRGLRVASSRDELVGDTKPVLLMLMSAVSLVLLVACVNVANLFLARALARRKEIAIRRALGAGSLRLLQQLFTEGFLLALIGVGAGLLAARTMMGALSRLIPAESALPGLDQVIIDGPVLLVVVATGALVTVLLGCVSAGQVLKKSPGISSERAATGGTGLQRLRKSLLATQVAFSLILLLGAGLLLRSFTKLMDVDPGFHAEGLLTAQLQMPPQQVVFFRQVQEHVRAIPGVEGVAAIEALPLSGSGITRRMLVDGRPRPEPGGEAIVERHLVTPDYFRTMGIPLQGGRTFLDADMNREHLVVVINQTMARRYWPNVSPIGQSLRLGTQATVANAPLREIVGVAGDVRHGALQADLRDQVYVPLGQDDWPVMQLVIRSARIDPVGLIPEVKSAVWAVDPNQTLPNLEPMSTIVADSVWQPRLNTFVLTVFAAVTLALALAGIYGLMVRIVGDRIAEIGIRMAMGATPGTVLLLVLRQGFLPVFVGAAVGMALALASGRFVATQLYGVTQADPLTFGTGALIIVGAAFLAMVGPALRATRIDPVIALRGD
jgi:putative ABC transport system permease protein